MRKNTKNSAYSVRETDLRRVIRHELHKLAEAGEAVGSSSGSPDAEGVELGQLKKFLVDLMLSNGADQAVAANLASALNDISKKGMKDIIKSLSTPELTALGKVFLTLIETDKQDVVTKAAALLKAAKQK